MGHTSVSLKKDKCVGCTICVRRCPTQAIRVRDGKAHISTDLCTDCGMCMHLCTHGAKVSETRTLDEILADSYAFKVALVPPSFFCQFDNTRDVNRILTGLKTAGFDDVFCVPLGAEEITRRTAEYIKEHPPAGGPWISSACPVTVRLIAARYPALIDNILPIISPMEMAARMAREYFGEMGHNDTGIYFISPCPAKSTEVHYPLTVKKSAVTDTVSMSEVYMKIRPFVGKITEEEVATYMAGGAPGLSWAHIGGESDCLALPDSLAVDGIESVLKILDDVENGNIEKLDFLEINACIEGCVGGSMAVENPFNAGARMSKVMRENVFCKTVKELEERDFSHIDAMMEKSIEEVPAMPLDPDFSKAMEKMKMRDEFYETLPKLDCASCGAPDCMAFAQEVVLGTMQPEECIFTLREKLHDLTAH